LTSVCGYFKLNIVNVLDSILDENIFYVSCDITSQISKDLIVCNEDFGAVYLDTIYGGVPPYTSSWYYNTNFIQNDVSFLDSLDVGLYTIIITDSVFCTDTVKAFLYNPPNFEININEINQIGCHGDSTGSIIFNFSGGRKTSYNNNYNYYLLHVNDTIREYSIKLFEFARNSYEKKGVILVDTKFEFGLDADDKLMLVDEIFTPDCSRFWMKDDVDNKVYTPYDKQIFRNYLLEMNWDNEQMKLSEDIKDKLIDNYEKIYNKIVNA